MNVCKINILNKIQNECEYDDDTRYCFNVEYYDNKAELIREYQLMFFPSDNSIEMV